MKTKLVTSLHVFLLAFALTLQTAGALPVFAENGQEVSDGSSSGGSDSADGGAAEGDADGDAADADAGSGDSGDSDDGSGNDEVYIPDEYYEPVQSNDISGWPQGEAIQASAGAVMDLDTGAFLYAKNIQRKLYPASITKILTALIVLENADPDDVITCTDAIYDVDEGASNIALQEGEQITVRDALYALMLESAGDAANALAVQVSGSLSAFCDRMNEKAQELGCTVSHFTNPSGFTDEQHYTCARDMALIAAAAYDNESFRKIISTKEYEIKPTNMTEESRYFANHHRMIQSDSEYRQDWCEGGKTGFTEAAWNTLVTFGEKDGMRLVCVLLHGNGADQNYLETTDLMNYGFQYFTHLQTGTRKVSPTLADAMDVHYLGAGADLEAPELAQKTADITGSGMVTVPQGTDLSTVGTAPFKGTDGTNALAGEYGTVCGQAADNQPTEGSIYYTFGGWPVGSRSVKVSPVSLSLTIPWLVETSVRMKPDENETGDKEQAAADANEQAWKNVEKYVTNLDMKRQGFWEKNRTSILLAACAVVLVLLILLLILLIRSTKNYRLRKKMRQAQEEARRREQEIEEKTTAEIEQELREAMAAQGQEQEERPSHETEEGHS